jgi:hypothetical protein
MRRAATNDERPCGEALGAVTFGEGSICCVTHAFATTGELSIVVIGFRNRATRILMVISRDSIIVRRAEGPESRPLASFRPAPEGEF